MAEFTLIIGNKNYSSWSLRPWIWMKHLGVEFDEIMVPLYNPDTNEKLSGYFSNGKVPVLVHNKFEVWDSLSICEYVAELFPQGLFWDPKQRAVMRSLCAEMHSSFTSLRSELPMNCRREPSPLAVSEACQTDINRIQDLWQHAAKYSDEKAGWLFGSFSIADAMFAPVVLRFQRYEIKLNKSATAYVDRLLQHPAMLEWIASGQAESQVIESEER